MTRVEVFSDGVLAIAITLLVVELPFDQVSQGELGHALGEHWPRFAAYVLSFLGAIVSLSAAAMCRHGILASLLDEAVDRAGVHRLLRNLAGSGAAYAAFALLALVSPIATMACYGVAAVWFLANSDFRALGRETVG